MILVGSLRPKAEWGASTGDVTADRGLVWSRADRTSRMLVEWSTDEGMRNPTRLRGLRAKGRDVFEAVADGDGPALGREPEIAGFLSAIKAAGLRTATTRPAPSSATSCISGSSSPARCVQAASARTRRTIPSTWRWSGRKPPDRRVEVTPAEGGQFLGEAAIEGRSGALTVVLKELDNAVLPAAELRAGARLTRFFIPGLVPGMLGCRRPAGALRPLAPARAVGRIPHRILKCSIPEGQNRRRVESLPAQGFAGCPGPRRRPGPQLA
ncbi:hypothetical protein [Dankookia sp. P2]|uniref:hypothetical protein n=1 Tax=Dankookia sp. P2 TaxID=3423955 RepID=UPI003D664219